MNIVLIGFSNAGKTSIGKLLAKKSNKIFIDSDYLIEQYYYSQHNILLTVREIYQKIGRQYFRKIEAKVIKELSIDDGIIATGGGAILETDNIMSLKNRGKLIYLSTSFTTLLTRLHHQPPPAFLDQYQVESSFANLYQQRKNIYKQVADIEITTDHQSIPMLAEKILLLMRTP